MKKFIIVLLASLFAIIIIFTFLNPTLKDFEEYLGISKEDALHISARRDVNGIVFSIYRSEGIGYEKFFAIAGNFWKMEP